MASVLGKFKQSLTALAACLAISTQVQALTVEHGKGTMEFDAVPQRVVVLGMSSLDVLDRLGIQPVGAVHDLFPPYLQEYGASTTNVGSLKEPDYETIYTLKPDVIIAEPRMIKLYDDLNRIAPTIMFHSQDANFWEGTQKNWDMLGKLFNKEAETAEIIADIKADITAINQTVTSQKLNTLMVMSNGSKLAMYDRNSRFSLLFDELGFINASETVRSKPTGAHGNLISFEYIAEANPSVMFVLDRDQAIGKEMGLAQKQFNNPLVTETRAVKEGRMIYVDPNAWYISNGGMTGVELVIDDVEKALK
ncbi:siderophore ABC transporter substrate-binding protein [Parendozoicomonas haliclonae]|uniref:Putative ABC transporter solute-binding protein YclQ n=1 Tax=Parendozoicomonas haliclonae TaxID=1960125 RepID=A0A1X7AMT4_9GAMM|nr:ABC transporter substrate-binding protein [Parendozoicomonas haliclonae]SMA47640.1 putative ABC transporter solute-binding protein YclQ precursor [Parendozoicomonas haliclonae]